MHRTVAAFGSFIASTLAAAGGDVPVPALPLWPGEAVPLQTSGPAGGNTEGPWFEVGDFDGDSVRDVLAKRFVGGSAIVLLRGDGFGGFRPQLELALPSALARRFAVGDLDEDGRDDFVATWTNLDYAQVFFSTATSGPAAFQAGPILASGTSPSSVAIADLDGDGHRDVLVSNTVSGGIGIWLGDGQGGLAAQPALGAGASPNLLFARDLDGDGDVDVASFQTLASKLFLYENVGGGALVLHGVANSASPLVTRADAGDLDHDGTIDFVVQSSSTTIAVLRGIGGLDYAPPVTYTAPGEVLALALHDANGDGNLDLWTGFTATTVRVALGAGNGTFPTSVDSRFGGPAVAFRFADLENDGRDEVLGLVKSGSALFALAKSTLDGAGGFASVPALSQASSGQASGVLADLDNDLDLDAFIADDGQFKAHSLLNDGSGGFAPVATSPSLGLLNVKKTYVRDLDQDSIADALIVDQSSGYATLPGLGGGAFGGVVHYATTNLRETDLADMDGDGDPDLVATLLSTKQIAKATNAGGTFGALAPIFTTSAPLGGGLALADFNGDGTLDAAASGNAGVPGYVLHLVRDIASPAPALVLTLSSANSGEELLAGDLNGDGRSDVVSLDHGTRIVTVLQGGIAGFLPAQSFDGSSAVPLTTPGTIGTLADVDADGTLDLLVRSIGVNVYRGDGQGGFAPPRLFLTGTFARQVSAGDVDADGRIDALVSGDQFSAFMTPWTKTPQVVLDQRCAGAVGKVGGGCPGSDGIEPRLWLDGCARPGGAVTLRIEDALGGAQALLFFGLQANDVALPNGCPLHTFPILPVVLALPLSGSGAGNGGINVPATLPATGLPDFFLMQAVIAPDAGAPGGFATTQAVAVVPR